MRKRCLNERAPAALAAVSMALLAACASRLPPRTIDPPMVPMEFRDAPGASNEAATPSWWTRPADPQLTALLQIALRRNHDLLHKSVLMEQLALRAALSAQDLWPTVSLNANGNVSRQLGGGNGSNTIVINGVSIPVASGAGTLRSSSTTLDASYEVDLWGRVRRGATAGRLNAQAAAADLEVARALLMTQVAEKYWTLAAVDRHCSIAALLLEDANDSLAATKLLYDVGKVQRGDVDASRRALATLEDAQQEFVRQREEARLDLAVLLDAVPETFEVPTPTLPTTDPPPLTGGFPARILDQRPDVRSARLALDAATLNLTIEKGNWYPQLSLSADLITGGDGLGQLVANPLGSLALSVALPMVDWRRNQLNRDLAQSSLYDAQAKFREVLYGALVDVEKAFIARRQLLANIATSHERVAAADRGVEVALLRYTNGAAGLQMVRDAHVERHNAESEAIDLRLRLWTNYVLILKVLGAPLRGDGSSVERNP